MRERYCRTGHAGQRLYRDRENGLFFGVCAGLAEFFDVRVLTVRVIAVVALLLFFWPTALLYVTLGLLLRDRPLYYRGLADETSFWRRGGSYEGGR